MCVKVTTFAGIDLRNLCTGGMYPVGIIGGLLIALNHGKIQFAFQVGQCSLKQGGFARTGRTYEVHGKNVFGFKPTPVSLGKQVVLVQNIRFHIHNGFAMTMVMVVAMIVAMMVVMTVVVFMTVKTHHCSRIASAGSTHKNRFRRLFTILAFATEVAIAGKQYKHCTNGNNSVHGLGEIVDNGKTFSFTMAWMCKRN
jgi:hypothetical protein